MIHIFLLLACAVVIYLACEWFVNAVEWLGARMKVGPVAVGTVLAAVGTALPESVVTFVAVVFGSGQDSQDIGVGAAMGGPLALSTVAYAVAGFMLIMLARKLTNKADVLKGVDVARLGETRFGSWSSLSSKSVWGWLRSLGNPGSASCSLPLTPSTSSKS